MGRRSAQGVGGCPADNAWVAGPETQASGKEHAYEPPLDGGRANVKDPQGLNGAAGPDKGAICVDRNRDHRSCHGEARPRLLLYYPPGFSVDSWSAHFALGERPEKSHWGMHLAHEHGFRVASSADSVSKVWRMMSPFRLLRFDLAHLAYNLRALRDCDIVWAATERELIAALVGTALRWRKGSKPVICGEVVWLNDEWVTYSWLRRWVLRRMLPRADGLLIVTEGGAQELRRLIPGARVQSYRFGIPAEIYAAVHRAAGLEEAVTSGRPVRVLVAGNDLRRDWGTVARAFGNDHRFEVVLLSRRPHVADFAAYGSNLRYVPAGQLQSLLQWYAWADIAVISSQPNKHGAGLTMLLEAAAVGIPLICTRTGDIDEYLPPDSLSYVPPSDPEAMRAAAVDILENPAAAARRVEIGRAAARDPSLGSAAARQQRCRILHERLSHRACAAMPQVREEQELAGTGLAGDR